MRDLTRTILANQGYAVVLAESAAAAEELARRGTAKHPKIRVLFMSGYTDNVIASGSVLEAGVAFLQKPFTPRAPTQKVREVLDRRVPVR